jgi:CTP synthase
METGYPEAFEIEDHPFYAAVLYHPEYLSRPGKPHPLFTGLIRAAKERTVR